MITSQLCPTQLGATSGKWLSTFQANLLAIDSEDHLNEHGGDSYNNIKVVLKYLEDIYFN